MKTPNPIILSLLVLLISSLFFIANAQTNQAPSQPKNNHSTSSPNICPKDSTNPAPQTVPDDSGNKVEGDKTIEKNDGQKPADRYQDLWKSDKRKDFRRFLDLIKTQPIV